MFCGSYRLYSVLQLYTSLVANPGADIQRVDTLKREPEFRHAQAGGFW
jgi:hypothetical protein